MAIRKVIFISRLKAGSEQQLMHDLPSEFPQHALSQIDGIKQVTICQGNGLFAARHFLPRASAFQGAPLALVHRSFHLGLGLLAVLRHADLHMSRTQESRQCRRVRIFSNPPTAITSRT